ncbi:MAG: 4-oxalocrotonate tautomerase [Reyranella sp.]|nr:4-oxalocrotonate tautomerase [Reyranella sp.]
MDTPTSRTKAISTLAAIRISRPGWRAWRRSQATSPSTTRSEKERTMPMIRVEMFEGRSTDQRRKLAKELTEGTCRALGCTPDAVQIVLTDIKKENWAEAGKLFSDQ